MFTCATAVSSLVHIHFYSVMKFKKNAHNNSHIIVAVMSLVVCVWRIPDCNLKPVACRGGTWRSESREPWELIFNTIGSQCWKKYSFKFYSSKSINTTMFDIQNVLASTKVLASICILSTQNTKDFKCPFECTCEVLYLFIYVNV